MTTSLTGYGLPIHRRDGFKCRYCGADGTKSFDTWLTLSVDHLLPPNHPRREEEAFKVTACRFCNEADNRYFSKNQGLDNLSPDELFQLRKKAVLEVRASYQEFWIKEVVLPQLNLPSEA